MDAMSDASAKRLKISPEPLPRRVCAAPMMDWTDRHCRRFFRALAPHALLYTEMVVADAILNGRRERLLGFDPIEQPLALQLGGSDADKLAACQGLSPGEISVWSGNGEGICYFGELIALGMKERGCVGALLDGGIRDVRWLGEHQFPVFARYKTSVQSIGRWKVNAWQIPIYLRGHDGSNVTVRPGDFILADEDGGIVIPVEIVESVLIEAERLTVIEKNIRTEIANGLSLAEALKKYGHV